MKICKKCKAINTDDKMFCVDCGETLTKKLSATEEQKVQAEMNGHIQKMYKKKDWFYVSEAAAKKIIIIGFSLLIVITAIAFIISARNSYNYDMDPENGVDILEGFGAVLTLLVGGFVVLYELDLFHAAYYFFIKPKTEIKTFLNILCNGCLLFTPLFIYLFFLYVALRIAYFVIIAVSDDEGKLE